MDKIQLGLLGDFWEVPDEGQSEKLRDLPSVPSGDSSKVETKRPESTDIQTSGGSEMVAAERQCLMAVDDMGSNEPDSKSSCEDVAMSVHDRVSVTLTAADIGLLEPGKSLNHRYVVLLPIVRFSFSNLPYSLALFCHSLVDYCLEVVTREFHVMLPQSFLCSDLFHHKLSL